MRQTEVAVRSASNIAGVCVVLSVILPEAYLADLEPSALRERSIPAAGAAFSLGSHECLRNFVFSSIVDDIIGLLCSVGCKLTSRRPMLISACLPYLVFSSIGGDSIGLRVRRGRS
jgi:hypothetical protein